MEYLSCMSALFNRYGKVTSDVQLDIVVRNLAPFYTMQLPVVRNLDELERECLKLEVKKYRADNYQAPATRSRARLAAEPDLAYVSSNSELSASEIRTDIKRVSSSVPDSSSICFNCRKVGHQYRNCPSPRNKHCFRCGRSDVTVRTCPNCNSVAGTSDRNQGNSMGKN